MPFLQRCSESLARSGWCDNPQSCAVIIVVVVGALLAIGALWREGGRAHRFLRQHKSSWQRGEDVPNFEERRWTPILACCAFALIPATTAARQLALVASLLDSARTYGSNTPTGLNVERFEMFESTLLFGTSITLPLLVLLVAGLALLFGTTSRLRIARTVSFSSCESHVRVWLLRSAVPSVVLVGLFAAIVASALGVPIIWMLELPRDRSYDACHRYAPAVIETAASGRAALAPSLVISGVLLVGLVVAAAFVGYRMRVVTLGNLRPLVRAIPILTLVSLTCSAAGLALLWGMGDPLSPTLSSGEVPVHRALPEHTGLPPWNCDQSDEFVITDETLEHFSRVPPPLHSAGTTSSVAIYMSPQMPMDRLITTLRAAVLAGYSQCRIAHVEVNEPNGLLFRGIALRSLTEARAELRVTGAPRSRCDIDARQPRFGDAANAIADCTARSEHATLILPP